MHPPDYEGDDAVPWLDKRCGAERERRGDKTDQSEGDSAAGFAIWKAGTALDVGGLSGWLRICVDLRLCGVVQTHRGFG